MASVLPTFPNSLSNPILAPMFYPSCFQTMLVEQEDRKALNCRAGQMGSRDQWELNSGFRTRHSKSSRCSSRHEREHKETEPLDSDTSLSTQRTFRDCEVVA